MASLSSSTGVINGNPTAAGTYHFTITATDAIGETAHLPETITIESGSNLSPLYAVAARNGGSSRIEVYDRTSNSMMASFFAFEPNYRGGANVVVGDVNGDGVSDIVVSAGVSGSSRVIVIDGTKLNQFNPDGSLTKTSILADLFAFDSTMRGGSSVALGRLDNSPGLSIIVGAGVGGGPRVRVFDLSPSTPGGVQQVAGAIGSFYAFDSNQRNGVNVAAGNLEGTGLDDIIVGEGLRSSPNVAVYHTDGTLRNQFAAYDASFTGGVFVAAGYLDGTSQAQLITGAGPGGPAVVNIYNGTSSTPERTVQAFEQGFTGGVTVNSGPVGSQSGIFLGAGGGGTPRVRVLTADGLHDLSDFDPYETTFRGGVQVG